MSVFLLQRDDDILLEGFQRTYAAAISSTAALEQRQKDEAVLNNRIKYLYVLRR